MESVSQKLVAVKKRINQASKRSGRDPSSVCLVTVTKTVDSESINEAISSGATVIGENRVQEAREKFPALKPCTCHLIGNLQKNKVKYIFDLFTMVQSVDSIGLAVEIDRRAAAIGRTMEILVQINIGMEGTKHGVSPVGGVAFFESLNRLENVLCRGIMCIPPFLDNPEESRPYFKRMVELKNTIEEKVSLRYPLTELSMGMTNDFEVAIEEGATIVRVGRAIFGGRN